MKWVFFTKCFVSRCTGVLSRNLGLPQPTSLIQCYRATTYGWSRRAYRHTVDLSVNSTCSTCCVCPRTVEHWFTKCPVLLAARLQLVGSFLQPVKSESPSHWWQRSFSWGFSGAFACQRTTTETRISGQWCKSVVKQACAADRPTVCGPQM